MSPKLKILVVLCVLTVGLVGYALARTLLFKKTGVPHALVLVDSSGSVLSNCSSIAALSREAIKLPHMQPQSTLTVVSTGDESTANEPRMIGAYPVPISNKAFEGEKQAKQKQEGLLSEIVTGCEKIPTAKNSSIFLGLKNGVEHLKSKGCNEKTNCAAFVSSDLQENVEPQIRDAIKDGKLNESNLPGPIDNRGIRITLCGIAETRGLVKDSKGKPQRVTQDRNAERSDLIRQVWAKLFTEPEIVTFSSFCPSR